MRINRRCNTPDRQETRVPTRRFYAWVVSCRHDPPRQRMRTGTTRSKAPHVNPTCRAPDPSSFWKGWVFEFASRCGPKPRNRSSSFITKNRTLANSARMRHPHLKITRGLAFAHSNNVLALRSVTHRHLKEFVTVLLGRRDEFRARGAHWGASAADSEG